MNLFGKLARSADPPTTLYDLKAFKARLAALPADDPLWPQLLGFLDSSIVFHARTQVSVEDGAAHRFCGRMGMLADLHDDLQKLWRDAHEP